MLGQKLPSLNSRQPDLKLIPHYRLLVEYITDFLEYCELDRNLILNLSVLIAKEVDHESDPVACGEVRFVRLFCLFRYVSL